MRAHIYIRYPYRMDKKEMAVFGHLLSSTFGLQISLEREWIYRSATNNKYEIHCIEIRQGGIMKWREIYHAIQFHYLFTYKTIPMLFADARPAPEFELQKPDDFLPSWAKSDPKR